MFNYLDLCYNAFDHGNSKQGYERKAFKHYSYLHFGTLVRPQNVFTERGCYSFGWQGDNLCLHLNLLLRDSEYVQGICENIGAKYILVLTGLKAWAYLRHLNHPHLTSLLSIPKFRLSFACQIMCLTFLSQLFGLLPRSKHVCVIMCACQRYTFFFLCALVWLPLLCVCGCTCECLHLCVKQKRCEWRILWLLIFDAYGGVLKSDMVLWPFATFSYFSPGWNQNTSMRVCVCQSLKLCRTLNHSHPR